MAITLPGQSGPSADFGVPLLMLEACHRRVEAQCATIRRLAEHLPVHGADEQARSAARAVMRYFDTAARDHHADEERDVFPAVLEAVAGSDATCVRQITSALAAEHRVLERRWTALRAELEDVAEGRRGELSLDTIEAFLSVYELHIAVEEREFLPMATRLLGDAELDRIGRSMLRRRGLPDDELGATASGARAS